MDLKPSFPTVTFQLLTDDILALRRYLSNGRSANVTKIIVLVVAVIAAALFLSFFFSPRPTTPGGTVPYGGLNPSIMGFAGLYIFLFLLVTLFKRSSFGIDPKSDILQHQSEVTLLPDAFSISYGVQTSSTHWDGIKKIEATPTHLFIFIVPQDAFIIPRRAFDSGKAFTAFIDYALYRWNEARPQTPPIARA